MKQEGISPIPNQQGLFKSFKPVRLLSFLISFITICVYFLGLGALNQTLATNYYVDSSITDTNPANATPDCTNYNTGTFTCSGGAGSAYKTIADVNAKSFSPDDQVLFRKGQTWREQLIPASSGTSGHPIIFSSFGSGAKPVISGADVINGFSNGGSNIWDKAGVITQPYVVSFSGTVGTLASSRANCNAPGKWYWTGNTLSVYATSDPSGTIEAGQRDYNIYTSNLWC